MKKILFATDFSAPANNAFAYALELAKAINASLSILHVFNEYFITRAEFDRDEYGDTRPRELEVQVKELGASIPPELQGDLKVVFGTFADAEIADEARDNAYDLIIMGMKGEHHQLEKWMGSVTTSLMMKAPCPVLAIPEKANYQGIKKIAMATALPSSADIPKQQVMAFAEAVSAKLEFVTVDNIVRQSKDFVPDQPKKVFFGTEFHVITNPSIPEGLNNFVLKNEADVLSLYMRKRHLWERIFHISTSREMAYHTKIPLFVFHN
ncbi:MAG: universal stress protein [Bacteroidota bacterium]